MLQNSKRFVKAMIYFKIIHSRNTFCLDKFKMIQDFLYYKMKVRKRQKTNLFKFLTGEQI